MHLVLCERSFSLQQHPGLKSRCRLSCCRAKELDTIPKQLRQRVAVACPFDSPRLTTALWIVRDLTRPIPFQQVRRQCTAHEDIYVRFSRSVHLTTLATLSGDPARCPTHVSQRTLGEEKHIHSTSECQMRTHPTCVLVLPTLRGRRTLDTVSRTDQEKCKHARRG